MKLVISVVAAVVLVGLIVALGRGTAVGPGPSTVGTPVRDSGASPAEASTATDDDAVALLRDVFAAYRDAPNLTDTMRIVYQTPSGEQTVTYEVGIDGGRDAALVIPKYRIIARDDTLYVVRDKMEHKYLQASLEGDPMKGYAVVGQDRPVPLHFAMLWTDDVAKVVPSMTMGQLRTPRLGAVSRDVPNPARSGGKAHEITIEAENGSGRVFVDADSNLLAAAEMDFVGQDGRDYGLQISFDPKVVSTTPALLSFDPAGLFRVGTMEALDRIGVGEPIPPLRLMTADGKIMRNEHLLGTVTVLDFWATWCGPCKRALPLLEQFHVWTEETGTPVKVYAVDTWEKFPSSTQKISVANNYWTSQKFTMPLLLDIDDSVVESFGFKSIPTTVVVDAEGKVAKIHNGYDPALDETLKAEVQSILAR